MTTVRYSCKYVRNLGNFESVHIDFGIEDALRPGEDIETAKRRIENKVDSWVESKVNEIDRDARPASG